MTDPAPPAPDHAARVLRAVAEGDGTRSKYAEVPVGDLGGGEVLVRVEWSSMNYKDALAILGRNRVVRRTPLVLGCDAVGEVVESADSRHRVGERVVVTGFGMTEDHDGGYAAWCRVPASWAIPLPEGLSNRQAAIIGTAGITSALAIHRLEHNGMTPGGGPVAVSGASGGAGSLAVGMLARLGYEVVAFTGKKEAHDLLRRMGAAEVRDRPDVSSTRPLESARWAGAVDTVGGPVLAWLLRTADRNTSVATFGNTAGNDLDTSVLPFILRGVNLLGINTGWFPDELRAELWSRLGDDLQPEHLDEVGRDVPLDAVVGEAPTFLEGGVTGRIVVDVAE